MICTPASCCGGADLANVGFRNCNLGIDGARSLLSILRQNDAATGKGVLPLAVWGLKNKDTPVICVAGCTRARKVQIVGIGVSPSFERGCSSVASDEIGDAAHRLLRTFGGCVIRVQAAREFMGCWKGVADGKVNHVGSACRSLRVENGNHPRLRLEANGAHPQ
eukprot:1297163-Rhodomonas_salina.1